jgi:hypothetical protein
MRVQHVVLGGLFATIVLTTLSAAAQGLGLSRMSMPLLLGSIFTADRQRANVIGFLLHFVNGWAFASLYAIAFERLRLATWWLGGLLGLAQALFLLIAVMPLLPSLHPRMASEDFGPNPTRQLEPPGFMGLYYGRRTPLVTIAAHVIYGVVLGGFYTLSPA